MGRLSQIGLKLQVNTQKTDASSVWNDVLFAGKLSQFNRDSANRGPKGAQTADQINKNVSHLVAGESRGSKIKSSTTPNHNSSEQEFIELLYVQLNYLTLPTIASLTIDLRSIVHTTIIVHLYI